MTTVGNSILSLDQMLTHWVAIYGVWALGLVAAVIFAETGLVVAPFLPGDSLLFLTGTVLAAASLNVHVAVAVLILAAVSGDALNFAIGRRAAAFLIQRLHGRWLRQSHLDATHGYFERFGGSTIVIARFVPVVRTLAPFLAGAGAMTYTRFAVFNVAGAILWVASLVYAGAFLGSQPFVRQHLSAITAVIVILSLIPMAISGLRAWRSQ
ncbi:MAG: VTT domain-containing protein [Burkholderiaceae bacterium]